MTVPHQPADVEAGADGPQPEPDVPPSDACAEAVTDAPAVDGTKGQPALFVNQLTKRFGERTAFSEVSFQVAYGEVFGFLGPNGAGKTTTVRTLGTLIAPTSGSATSPGSRSALRTGWRSASASAVMPESPGLYLRLTVTENLEYFASLYGLTSGRGADQRRP